MLRENSITTDIDVLSPERRALLALLLQKKGGEFNSYPLSFAQQRLWFIDQLEPNRSIYNLPTPRRLKGKLNIAALEQALSEIVRRHESLRTSFTTIDGEPVQVVAQAKPFKLPLIDLSDLPEQQQEAMAHAHYQAEAQQPFNLSQGPLIRGLLIKLDAEDHLLVLTMHHIISDGWSIGVLLKELSILYNNYDRGEESPLENLPAQYADYSVWQREYVQGDVLEQQLDYWKQQLSGAPAVLELPTDRPRPAVQSYKGATEAFHLPMALSAELNDLARREGVTLFMTLLAAFQILLSRHNGQEDIVVGTPIAGRTRSQVEQLIGFFLNTLVLRTDLSGNPNFLVLLQRVKEVCLGAYAHQDVPFDKLVQELQPERSLSHQPLFQVLFSLENTPREELLLDGLEVSRFKHPNETAKSDLTLALAETEQGIKGVFGYSTDLFTAETVQRMARNFETLLHGIVSDPGQPLSDLPLLAEAEQRQLLIDWNQTQAGYQLDSCIHQLFEAQVEREPDSIALIYQQQQIGYGELNRRANQLAHYLRSKGVGPGTRVGICLHRSIEMVVGLLGVLKAGGAFVPLDPAYPQQRLAFMMKDSGAALLLSEQSLVDRLSQDGWDTILLDQDQATIAAFNDENPTSPVSADDIAYIIYTSGSTGLPKGVLSPHRASINRFEWMWQTYPFQTGEVCCQKTALSFVDSIWEIFGPLLKGIALVVLEDEVTRDPDLLVQALAANHVTRIVLVPSLLRAVLENCRDLRSRLPQLKYWISSGEPLSLELLHRFNNELPQSRLINLYGSSEVAADVSCFETWRIDAQERVPIGRPIANIQTYILDRHSKPVPPGVAGELYIGGIGLAWGYQNLPDLTAQKFVPNAFAHEPGARLCRSGDLARYLPDGNIEYLGRVDQQVKIRGIRIELGEVQSALSEHPAVTDAVIVAREDGFSEQRLVAYLVSEQALSSGELREYLRERLPEYMVPSFFVLLDSLPLTANGKLDRDALPAPQYTDTDSGDAYVAPRTPIEEMLCGIWSEVLNIQQVGVYDNFFDLGGHSLLATRVMARVRDLSRVEIPVRSLFEFPTVAALSDHIEQVRDEGQSPATRPISVISREGPLALSFAQQRLWFIDQMESGSIFYNIPMAKRLVGVLNVEALERALRELVMRHESLRTRFGVRNGEPFQVIGEAEEWRLEKSDLRALPPARREAAVQELVGCEWCEEFDLSTGPLFRVKLLQVDETEHVLLLTLHHIISDGWSLDILFRELTVLYNAYSAGQESPLPELEVQYADYAAWQREYLQGEVLAEQLSYWKEQLRGAPAVLELPADHARPAVQSYCGEVEQFTLPAELSEKLQQLSRRENVTLFMTMLAAFQVLLSRYSGQDDVVVGTPIAGRTRAELEPLIGFFVNTLALRADLSGGLSFRELLKQVRERCLGAYAHQDIPFEKLVEELQPQRSLSHQPLFQVIFQLQNGWREPLALEGLQIAGVGQQGETAKFDLRLSLVESDQGLSGGVQYSTDLFERSSIKRLVQHFEQLLESIVAAVEQPVQELRLLAEAERQQLLVEWNQTSSAYPQLSIAELFEQQAAQTPEAVAVIFDDEQLSYRELNERANQLAHYLRAQGVGLETLVGISLERSVELVVALLGVLKAGGAYLPLDADYPPERLALMLGEAEVTVLLTQQSLLGRLPAPLPKRVICLQRGGAQFAEQSRTNPAVEVGPDNLAYVIYTSGSTGVPKGVAIAHRSVVRLVKETNYASFTDAEVFLQLAPVSFDAATMEVWGPLLNGGRLVVFPATEPSLPELGAVLQRHQVTTLWLTSGLFHLMVDERLEDLQTVRQLLAGGDVLSPTHVRKAAEQLPQCVLINGYGPTENTTFSCCYAITEASTIGSSVPIGRPIANTQVYLLDNELQPVPLGVAGELCLGGAGLARGYLRQPQLTAEKFIPDPHGAEGGARLYRTGDLARYRVDGTLEFLGRRDQQVKIRGYRIEPGEIEAVLCQQEQVREAVVVVREQLAGDKRLIAYVSPSEGAELNVAELRSYLQERLPQYMMPAALQVLERLPLTPNGKVDRRALPEVEWGADGGGEDYMAPRTAVEELLVALWAELLPAERIGVEDNFFALGGHSLLATRLLSRVREMFGMEVPLRALFEGPTVAGLASQVERARWEGRGLEAGPLTAVSREQALPLSFAQQRLWFLDQLEPNSSFYNIAVGRRLQGVLDVPVLERSLSELARRHESLRTTFALHDSQPLQVIAEPQAVRLAVEDLSHLPEAEREAKASRLAREEAQQPFALSVGPLWRTRLLKLSDEEHVLLLTLHHIITDGWSMRVLFRELSRLYNAIAAGQPSPLAELPVQYADYAVWQRQYLQGEVLERQLGYWRKQLAAAPALLSLPTDHPRPAVQSYRGAIELFALPAEISQQLKALSRHEGVTPFMTFLAAFYVLLSRYSGQEDLVVGTDIANRTRSETEPLIGFFANTLPLRAELSGKPSFRELLKQIRETCIEAYAHQEIPFEKLVEELQPERSLSHQPLFQVFFSMLTTVVEKQHWKGLTVEASNSDTDTSKFDLNLTLADIGASYAGAIEYSSDLFEAETIRRMIRNFERVLESIIADASQSVTQLLRLTAAEHQEDLAHCNHTAVEYPKQQCVHQLFEEQAERVPNSVAIAFDSEQINYGELNRKANQLAHYLQEQHVGPEMLVGICMERSIEMIVAMLATLKAGAAYVPIDPSFPARRVNDLLEDTHSPLILTLQKYVGAVSHSPVKIVSLDSDWENISHYSDANAASSVNPDNLAYVMYTSGSTGKPKGVAITHENVNWLVHNLDHLAISESDTVAHASHPSFDAVVYEIWGALLKAAKIEIVSKETMLSAAELRRKLEDAGISVLYLTAAIFTQLASQEPTIFSTVKTVITGGEALANRWARNVLQQGGPEKLIHEYGPTEATVFSSIHLVEDVEAGERNLPIGKPLSNTQSYVLDEEMQPVPIGISGELYLGGDGIARGYWERAEQTAEKFVPDPFGERVGERLYRTGDVARYRTPGELEFIGRKDQQVKLRGIRIELEEIEVVLGACEGVQACKVIVRSDVGSDELLVAYIAAEKGTVSESEIREFLKERLPGYMVPSFFVLLDALPLTPNGKIDVRALPAPEMVHRDEGSSVAPYTAIEEMLCQIWSEVLEVETVGIDENFFDFGGHSLLVILVISRVREVFGVEIPVSSIFDKPTVRELAQQIETTLETRDGSASALRLQSVSREAPLALSFAQQRLWFIDQMEPGSVFYNVPMPKRLLGTLNVDALERALGELVRRHESLRTSFPMHNGEPLQVIAEAGEWRLDKIDLCALPRAEREAVVQELVRREWHEGFDLSTGPLFRVKLLQVKDAEHVLLLTMHHIIADGWSVDILFRELALLYNAYSQGQASPLADLEVQYADYAAWQREYLQGEVLAEQLSYWKEQLAGAPAVLELPTDHARPAVQSFRGDLELFELPVELSEKLQQLSQRENVTLFMTMLAAFQVLLSRYSGQQEVVVGTPVAGRTRAEVEPLIGSFVNTLALRADLSGGPSFRELLKQVRERCLGAYAHQDIPFEKLVEELQPQRSLSHQPLFQMAFQLQNGWAEPLVLDGLKVRGVRQQGETAKFDLTLSLVQSDKGLSGGVQYSTDLFERSSIKRLAQHYAQLLESIVAAVEQPVQELRLLGEAERRQLLVEWNQTSSAYPQLSIAELFEQQAAHTPEAVAVIFDDEQLSYRELNERANQLAHYLRAQGVGLETLVGISLERSVELVVALLGVLKAGGAYLPLDADYPPERLALMLGEAEVTVLLTQQSLLGRLPAPLPKRVICLQRGGAQFAEQSRTNPAVGAGPENLAYVNYTSGSTGQPKGILIPHRAVIRLLLNTEYVDLCPSDVVAQVSNCSFDAATFEIWGSLLTGASLVFIRKEVLLSPERLATHLLEQRVTTMFLTTALFNQIAREVPHAFKKLRQLLFGGEAVDVHSVVQVLEAGGPERLLHVYGPTESTTFATWQLVDTVEPRAQTVPIGRPISNTQAYILDEHLEPVVQGAVGELYLGGAGLAQGYLRRAELTAEKFVPDPHGGETGARLYRTGDLARHGVDGSIEFLGRKDQQIKLRGFRIELGEIEAVLCRHGQVREAVVVAREQRDGDKRLLVYVTASDGTELKVAELRSYLRERLPEYMVPAAIQVLPRLPLTPNGKVDRKALPEVQWSADADENGYVAPQTEVEELLCGVWSQVLKVEQVGVHENFFDLGGHSLLATRVVSRVRELFGVEVPLRALFEQPTVADFASHVERARWEGRGLQAAPLTAVSRQQVLPLSFAQQRLWFLDQLEPDSSFNNIAVGRRLQGVLDIAVLERSLSEMVRRHESLRTTFSVRDAQPLQVIAEPQALQLTVVDLSHLPEAEREAEASRLARAEAQQPFALSVGPLWRTRLLKLSETEHVLLLTLHHIIGDGWSMRVFFGELSTLYNAYDHGKESPLAPLPVQYADFAVWQRQYLQGEVLEQQLGYWRKQLAAAPVLLGLPTDRPRPPVQTYRGALETFEVPAEINQQLKALSRDEGVTPFMMLLAAFYVLLSRYSGQEDVVVGTPIANRTRSEIEPLIGFFANTLALRADLSGKPSFRQFLRQIRETCIEAYAHQDVPFEKLVEELQPERSLSHQPFFQVLFQLLNGSRESLSLAELSSRPFNSEHQTAQFDLTLTIVDGNRGMVGNLEYNTDLFNQATACRLISHLCNLLSAATASPDIPINSLSLISDGAETSCLLHDWNDTGRSYEGHPQLLHELVRAQCRRTPDEVALVCEGKEMTYAELDSASNALAQFVRTRGVGPEARVGVLMHRSTELVVCLLAVIKAGAAYVPLDPEYPQDRLSFMLEDSRAQVLLTQRELLSEMSWVTGVVAETIAVDDCDWMDSLGDSDFEEPLEISPDNLAYIIYTSGSTGRPKGAMNTHRGIVNRLLWMQENYALNQSDCVLQKTPFSFDVSVWEFFWPLLSGARLVLARPGGHRDPAYLTKLIEQTGVTTLHFVPPMLQVFLNEPALSECRSLRQVMCSGEALGVESVKRFHERLAGVELHNLYGPTEAAVDVSFFRCEPGSELRSIPIGRPVANTQLYVLDTMLQPVPVGVSGEVYIGGVQLARGYWRRADLTAERFIPHPHSASVGERLYRTGDLGRYLSDGNIEFLGRLDHQVKIRGYRIEIGEIEVALTAHDGVREAVVIVREDATAEKQLVAYVVREGTAATQFKTADLRDYLRGLLPEYMVPSFFVVFDALPLTANGKLDRDALPAPQDADTDLTDTYVTARTPVEEMLCGIWASWLEVEQVGVEDNFFEVGGHSLLATAVISQVREVFGVEIPVSSVFDKPTVKELARQIEIALEAHDGSTSVPRLQCVSREGPLALSFAQQRLWFIDQMEPGSAIYNIPWAKRLFGTLNVEALERALGELVRRHESLRTSFPMHNGEPVQVIAEAGEWRLEKSDLRALLRAEREAVVQELVRREWREGFDLSTGPLFRVKLLQVKDAEHVLLLTMHHIISDGWSLDILFRELTLLYNVYSQGQASPLADLEVQYADYAAWQREYLQGEVLAEQLSYWKEQLAGAPAVLELPTDHARPAVQSFRGDLELFELPVELSEKLQQLSQRENVTLFMTMLAAFQVLLSRYSGQQEVVVGTPIAGRTRAEVEPLIGFFVNTLALRADLSGGPSFRELLKQVRERCLGAYAHQDIPFEKLVEELQPQRSLSHQPLFQVMFQLQDGWFEPMAFEGLKVEGLRQQGGTAKFDLSLSLVQSDKGMGGGVYYSTDLFERSSIKRLAQHYAQLLESIVAAVEQPVQELRLLGEAERRQLLVEWNQTSSAYPQLSIAELFEQQAAHTPEAVAVIFDDEQLSYRELNERANQLAHYLRAQGVGLETLVGISLERSVELVVALLGVLKAGGAYLPLDADYPLERLALMLGEAEVTVLLTQQSLLGRLPAPLPKRVICLQRGGAQFAEQSRTNPAVEVGPENLAYVIYTSGSTGVPKGVAVAHRSVVRLVKETNYASFTDKEVFLQLAPISFDAATLELWGPLLNGGRLVLFPATEPSLPELGTILQRHQVTTLWLTSGLFQLMVDERLEDLQSVRQLLAGGDVLSAAHVRKAAEQLPQCQLINGYGPTENTTFSCCYAVGEASTIGSSVPIGTPIANTQAYLLDNELQPVPVGVTGELYFGGAGLARGYLRQPQLTAEKFIPSPHGAETGARLYRTGDLARYRADGTLEFLGRRDQQVKVRGYRIEPAEIEAVLRRQEQVREAVVVVREQWPGDKRLIAYVSPREGAELKVAELRSYVRERLPRYMMPAAIEVLERLPLTPNGKVDRGALPEVQQGEAGEHDYVAPRTEVEELLGALWAELLPAERIGVEDDFFALGGHSLLATRLLSRVREMFEVEVPLRALFEEPTVAGLASHVERARWEGRGLVAEPLKAVSRKQVLPLSFAQQRLWFLDQLEPGSSFYNIAVGRRLQGVLDVAVLERSLSEMVRRHESLRTTFSVRDAQPLQVIAEPQALQLTVVDLSHLPEAEREAEASRLARAEAQQPFALSVGPLWRTRLSKTERNGARAVVDAAPHHCRWLVHACVLPRTLNTLQRVRAR